MSSSAGQRELLKLTRLAHNRLCADCKVPLGEHRILASVTFCVFICEACSEQHIAILGRSALIKVATGDGAVAWNKEDVAKMQSGINNDVVNNTLERFVPQDWKKLNPNSSTEERKKWISAKYDVLYFSFPDGLNYTALQQQRIGLKLNKNGKRILPKDDATLPVRIADFFLTVGAGECKQFGQDFRTKTYLKGGAAKAPLAPEDISFKPCLVNCCPPESDYTDMELPEFLAPCVFPCDLHLSAEDRPPFSFTFVLTNASGMKLYGSALHVYELVEPEDLASMLGHPVGSSLLPNWPIVYVPKALTVVSHYPFYSAFTGFLRNIYHISLSNAPMPIERYVINFLQEVPLPPLGRVDVRYFMPNNLKMTLSRPPPNKLPMTDFSYRPLFASLSVENIIIVFQCLCAELTVCICSDNLSLLTPVQEAFLSFLFPLVWQGCYIPVMPLNMIEILDAPVPFLIGVHSQYLNSTPKERRPQSVVFVDLQKDTVDLGSTSELYGTDLTPRFVDPLPKQIRLKLKAKLTEFGGIIHRQRNHMDKLKTAGTAFPSHEQLTPITDFQSNSAMSQSDHASRPPSPPSNTSPDGASPHRSVSPGAKSDGGGMGDKSTINMSVLEKLLHSKTGGTSKFGNGKSGASGNSGKDTVNGRSNAYGLHQLAHAQLGDVLSSSVITPPSESILDPLNNTPFGYTCTFRTAWAGSSAEENAISGLFDAIEIRNAFLRVFVVLLTDYVETYTSAATASTVAIAVNSINRSRNNSHSSGPQDDNESVSTTGTSHHEGKERYLRGVQENIISINQKHSSTSSITTTVSSTSDLPKKKISFLTLGLLSKNKDKAEGESEKKSGFRKANDSANVALAPFDHDAFVKGQKDSFLRQLLETQMFCSYEEECGAGPSSPKKEHSSEVTFFEESILAKKNRSALSYKAFTPFLSDTSNNVVESYTAPEPTGWGLPVSNPSLKSTTAGPKEGLTTFSYPQFPALTPALYGPIRPARLLLQKPEKGRQLSQSSKELQETIEARTRTLGRTNSSRSMSDSASKKQALKERMARSKIRNLRVLQSIIMIQSLYRMLRPRRAYKRHLMAIQRIQRVYRAHVKKIEMKLEAKRRSTAIFASMVKKVQAFWRMSARRKEYSRCRIAVVAFQSVFRRRVLRRMYVRKRAAVILIETQVRGWMVMNQEKRNRSQMALLLRNDILLLWEREFTPLGYRSKFYLMIEGESYLHLALYEEEKKRLVESLGGKYVRSSLITGRFKKTSTMGARNSLGYGDKGSTNQSKGDNSPSRNPLMGSRKASNLASHMDANHNNMTLRLDGMERITVIGVPSQFAPHVEARLAISAQMLKDERKEMYLRLRTGTAESVRESLYKMFEFDKKMKKKKATLSTIVWTNREEAHLLNSAHAVLTLLACTHSGVRVGQGQGTSTTGSSPGGPTPPPGGNSDWLNAKLRNRVQGACVDSVRACMISIQIQRDRELREKNSRMEERMKFNGRDRDRDRDRDREREREFGHLGKLKKVSLRRDEDSQADKQSNDRSI